MTLHNQMVPGNHDDVEIEWHGGPREQGGYPVARPVDSSIAALNEAFGRYERAGEAADEGIANTPQQETIEAHNGTVRTDMLRTITVAGAAVDVDPTVFDDFELLESLAEIQRGDILALPKVFRAVVGDQSQELLDAVRDERGRVTATAATEMLVQIMRELAPKA